MDIGNLLGGTTVANPNTELAGGKADASADKLADSYQTFLTLLTAQMKHQDPMDPMKSGEFTQQLVAFSGVEQQIQANQNLEKLSLQLAQNSMNSAASYLGKTAVVQHDVAKLHATGADWEYRNDVATTSIDLTVKDLEGNIVHSSVGKSGLGMQKFHWDGLDMSGNPMAEGAYQLEIKAKNTADESVTVTSFIKDIISSIDTQGVEPIYTVGSVPVGAKGILALYN